MKEKNILILLNKFVFGYNLCTRIIKIDAFFIFKLTLSSTNKKKR